MNEIKNSKPQEDNISLWPAIFFCLIQLCTVTDNSALMNASSAIADTFKANVAELQAANIMYPLMAGSIMIAAGFLGNVLGWKRLMQAGLVILAAGELLSVISPNITIFVYGARTLVGIGASLSIPAILGLITIMYKKKQQAVVFGLIAGTIALASALAPVISGLIIVYLNWQTVFVILVVLFLTSLGYVSFCIKTEQNNNSKKSIDFTGFILLFIGLCIFIMGLMGIVKWGLINPVTPPFTILGYSPCILFVVVGAAILWLLLKYEWKREKNKGVDTVLIPKAFIKNRQTFSSLSMSAFIYLTMGGAIFLMFIFLQIFFNANAVKTGLVMVIFAAGMIPFSIFTPQFGGNFSPRAICTSGIIISAVGCICIGFGISVHGIGILFYLGLLLLGIGSGLVASQANFITATSITDKRLASQSSGMQGAMRNIGQAVSIAVISAVFLIAFNVYLKASLAESKNFNKEFKEKIIKLKVIPTSERNTVIKILKTKYSVSEDEIKKFLSIYWNSSVDAFRFANVTLAVILLLFLFLAKDICSDKLKDILKQKEKQ